jgi:DNA-binding transcriptional MerR regulator
MKLGELAKAAGVSKDTIYHYLREGLLPKPRLRRKKLADYDESYVERIHYIKDLQKNYALPISSIKKIISRQKKVTPLERALFRLQTKYFNPRAHLLNREIVGEEAFREVTGLGEKWLKRFEEWGIITPELRDRQKVYSYEDLTLGNLIIEMDNIGIGPKDGFDRDALKHTATMLKLLIKMSNYYFAEIYWDKLPKEDFWEKGSQALEIMAIYFYHLFRKFSREDTTKNVKRLEEERRGKDPIGETDVKSIG